MVGFDISVFLNVKANSYTKYILVATINAFTITILNNKMIIAIFLQVKFEFYGNFYDINNIKAINCFIFTNFL